MQEKTTKKQMRATDVDINEFATIKELHEFLDVHALELERKLDITDLLVKYRMHTADVNEKQLAQWDLECFLFDFMSNHLFSFSTSNGSEPGEKYHYPDLDKFQQAAFNYVKQRAEDAKNPLLKAAYNHLLWKAPSGIKHKQYACEALTNYFEVIEHYLQLFERDEDDENYFQITRKFQNLIGLAGEVNERIEDVNQLVSRLLFEIPSIKFYHKESILRTMLDYPTVFKVEAFANTDQVFKDAIEEQSQRTDYFTMANYYLKTAIRIASKTGEDVRPWHDEIGECYVRLAETEKEGDRAWIKQTNYAHAIHSFRQAGNIKRKEEIELLHDKLKDVVTLQDVKIPYDKKTISELEKWQEEIDSVTSLILQEGPDLIYAHISSGIFFPTKDFLRRNAVRTEAWMIGVRTIKFDINKNIRNLFNENESDEEGFWQAYRYQLKHSIIPYLHNLFIKGIETGKLTFSNFIEYLAKNTWLGQTLSKTDLGGEVVKYNWLSMVAPSITECFFQIQAALLDKTYKPNFIICIDSLTLKFEGLLRDFSQTLDVSVSKGSQKGIQVKYLHDLLQDETVQKYFSEDDRLFFDFLFVNKEGSDMRNNVAHCFYDYNDYDYVKMLLLMAALLRIGKYKFSINAK